MQGMSSDRSWFCLSAKGTVWLDQTDDALESKPWVVMIWLMVVRGIHYRL